MKTTADARRRVTLPQGVRKGDVFDVEPDPKGFVLVKLEKPKKGKVRLVKRGGLLLGVTDNPISHEDALKAIKSAL